MEPVESHQAAAFIVKDMPQLCTSPPYGYKKSEDNSKQIVPDMQTAEVVRHIFRLCAEGRGPSQIAKQLKAERVLTPANCYYRQTGVALVNLDTTRPYNWSNASIANILCEAGLDEGEAILTDETPAAASAAPTASTGPAA